MTRIIYKKRLKFTFQAFAYTICLIMKSQVIIFFILSKHKPLGIIDDLFCCNFSKKENKYLKMHYIGNSIYIT